MPTPRRSAENRRARGRTSAGRRHKGRRPTLDQIAGVDFVALDLALLSGALGGGLIALLVFPPHSPTSVSGLRADRARSFARDREGRAAAFVAEGTDAQAQMGGAPDGHDPAVAVDKPCIRSVAHV